MALNNIESLPEEILIEIFKYLSPNMIKTCCAVSKRWNEIVNNSRQLMQTFQLRLGRGKMEEYKAMPMRRNYQAIECYGISEGSFFNVINPYFLNSLMLSCTLRLSQLVKALNNLHTLEVLGLYNLNLEEEISTEYVGVAKLNLRTLNLSQAYYSSDALTKFLEILDVNTLHELSFKTVRYDDDNVNSKGWITFLGKQIDLQRLIIGKLNSSDFANCPQILEFKFRLKSLTLKHVFFEDNDNFIKFLTIHKGTLESLILGKFESIHGPYEIYKFIWNNLSLKAIDVNFFRFGYFDEEIDSNLEFVIPYTPKFPVESIKFLKHNYPEDIESDFFGFFISSMPSLKHLDLSKIQFSYQFSWNRIIAHICNEMKDLRVLHMPKVFDPTVLAAETIYFPKLVEFHMEQNKIDGICHFIRRHSKTLEIISFRSNEDCMELILDEVFNCENLKLVELAEYSLKNLRIYNKLGSRVKQDKPWRLNTSRYLFKFPDDAAYWNQHFAQGINN